MNVLLASTATDNSSLAGIHLGYGHAFWELGHEVTSIAHAHLGKIASRPDEYDFFLLRDTFQVDAEMVKAIAGRCKKFALFTHAECLQAERDARFIEYTRPDYVFLDQPLGHTTALSRLDTPMTFLGYGANHLCRMSPDKDIDVAFFGNAYPERQPRVVEHVFPLKDSEYNVKIHGSGQPDGPLGLEEMFEAMSRTKIVINICGAGCPELGYGGRRILDAMASGCAVVADRFATDLSTYTRVTFTDTDSVAGVATFMLERKDGDLREKQLAGYKYVQENWMIKHVAQKMIELVGLGGLKDD